MAGATSTIFVGRRQRRRSDASSPLNFGGGKSLFNYDLPLKLQSLAGDQSGNTGRERRRGIRKKEIKFVMEPSPR